MFYATPHGFRMVTNVSEMTAAQEDEKGDKETTDTHSLDPAGTQTDLNLTLNTTTLSPNPQESPSGPHPPTPHSRISFLAILTSHKETSGGSEVQGMWLWPATEW